MDPNELLTAFWGFGDLAKFCSLHIWRGKNGFFSKKKLMLQFFGDLTKNLEISTFWRQDFFLTKSLRRSRAIPLVWGSPLLDHFLSKFYQIYTFLQLFGDCCYLVIWRFDDIWDASVWWIIELPKLNNSSKSNFFSVSRHLVTWWFDIGWDLGYFCSVGNWIIQTQCVMLTWTNRTWI